MSLNKIQRAKYLKLMVAIDDLEDRVDKLEKKKAAATRSTPALDAKLQQAQEKLGALRTELTRVSDGCGTPHQMN